MKALLLAGGLGTRLRPLTLTTPKPLLSIDEKPLLAYHLDHLRAHGITDVLINTHYLHTQIEDFVASYMAVQPKNFTVSTTYEPELLGSAGTLRANKDFFTSSKEPFLVVYGDNLTDIDYTKFIAHHKGADMPVTIASYYEQHPEQKGIIEYDEDLVIRKFIEKPKPEEVTSNFANAGMYIMDDSVFETLEAFDELVLDFGYHIFPKLLSDAVAMRIYQMDETLLDIGNIENYTKAQSLPKIMNLKRNYD
jgi:mannose-1-phosphate guanylyltransferase